MAAANRQDAAAQKTEVGPACDSSVRRQHLSESLEGRGDRETINSQLLVEKQQGAPATAAVASEARTSKMAK